MAFGAGPDATPLPLGVELYYGAAWHDITADVILMDPIEITRGRPDEGSSVEPSAMSLTLNNAGGKYSPRNPNSPLFGLISRNTPIRTWIEHGQLVLGSNRHYRFTGEVPEWPQRWTDRGEAYTQIRAAGIQRRLGQGAPLTRSAFKTSARKLTTATAYWPMEDAEGSTSIAPEIGTARGQTFGAVALSSYDGFVCSDPLPVFGTGRVGLTMPYTAPTGQWLVRFLGYIPAAGTVNGSSLCRIIDSSFGSVDLVYSTGGVLTLYIYDTFGTLISTLGPGAFAVNGKHLQYQIQAKQNGANIDFTVATLEVGQPSGGSLGVTATSRTLGRPMSVTFNSTSANLADVSMGHCVVEDQVTTLFALAASLDAYAGDRGPDRIYRLCSEASIPIAFGYYAESSLMGPQARGGLVELLGDAAEVDGGILYEPKDYLGLYFRPIESLYSQSAKATLDFAGGGLVKPFDPTDDDQRTRNQITVSRSGGDSVTLSDPSGPLGSSRIGLYDDSVTLPLYTDAQAVQQAGWRLNLGTVDESRYPVIGVDLAHPTLLADPTLTRNLLTLDIGDRLDVTNLPAWLPPFPVRQLVMGVRETIKPFSYRLEWNCVPASPYEVGFYDTTGDRYSSGVSTLASTVNSTATTLSVASTGGVLWTTAGGDMPFQVVMNGELITVTGVSGASSPQTFTVTRSVNGVAKSHTAGSVIDLADPVRYGL